MSRSFARDDPRGLAWVQDAPKASRHPGGSLTKTTLGDHQNQVVLHSQPEPAKPEIRITCVDAETADAVLNILRRTNGVESATLVKATREGTNG